MAENDSKPDGDTTPDPNAPPDGDAAGKGSTGAPDELSVLKSRYQGQTAKVNTLEGEKATLTAQLAVLQAQLGKAQTGEIDKDEALKAQLAAKDAEIAAAKREVALAKSAVKYPEAYAVLGEDIASLSDVKLSEIEARLKGEAAELEEPPTPRGSNPSRTGQRTPAKPLTKEDVIAKLEKMPLPWSRAAQ
jgi:hypothetical protein